MTPDEETALSEITILPDGRVYVFGMSLQVLEVLQTLRDDEPRLQALRQRARIRCGHGRTGETPVPPGNTERKVD